METNHGLRNAIIICMIYVLPTTYSSYQIGSYKGGGKVPAAAERRCPHYSREKAQVEQVVRDLVDAINRRDSDDLAALFTNDTTALVPGIDAVQGIEGVKDIHQMIFDQNVTETLPKPNEELFIDRTCTLAWSRGEFGTTAGDQYKYFLLYEKIDGKWKIRIDMFNEAAK